MATYSITVPVEPGEPVYVLDPCYCTPHWIDQCRMRNGTSIRKKDDHSALAVYPTENRKGRAHCWKMYKRPFDPIKHLALWGKRVFATEAEAANAAKAILQKGATKNVR